MTPEEDLDLAALKTRWTPFEVFGTFSCLIPFYFSYEETTSTSSSYEGGGLDVSTTVTKHMDYVAVTFGAIAIVCALLSLKMIGRAQSRALRLGVCAILLVFGGMHIAYGVLGQNL